MRHFLLSAFLFLARSAFCEDFEDVDVSKAIFETVILQEISPDFTETDLTAYHQNLFDHYNHRLSKAKAALLTLGAFDANYVLDDGSSIALDCYHSPRQNLTTPTAPESYENNVRALAFWLSESKTPPTKLKSGFLAAAIALTDPRVGFSPPTTKDFQRVRIIALIANKTSEIGSESDGTPAPHSGFRPFSLTEDNDCTSSPPTIKMLNSLLKTKDAYLAIVVPKGEVDDAYASVCHEIEEGRCSIVPRSQPFSTSGTELIDEIVEIGNFVIVSGEEDEPEEDPEPSSSSSSSSSTPSTSASSTPSTTLEPTDKSNTTVSTTKTVSTSDSTRIQQALTAFVSAMSIRAVARL